MSTDTPDPRIRSALTLVDSPYLDRDDAGLVDDDRDALDLIARIMGEFHALAPAAPRRGAPAFRWGTLEVHEEIGRGSFGVVYLARDPLLDLEVALKLQRLDDGGDAHAIIAEARRLARVRHVNVSAVLGVDVHDGQVGLWTEHIPGRTLAARLDGGPLSVPEAIRVGAQLARALHAVHVADLVHGDLTANNVIESPDGRIVLTDFGSSMVRAAGHAAGIPRTGTPLAMAPELFLSSGLSTSSDIYALGALLFRLLTAEHLVPGRDLGEIARAHRVGARRSLTAYRDDVPEPLEEVISRATALRPEERYPSAAAMLDVLSRSGVPPHNLPRPATSFVGREKDLSAIRTALKKGRLVTLTGAGGVGKTRLAIETAGEELHAHPHGVWLVELDDVAGSGGVPTATARACGLLGLAQPTADGVAEALKERRLLLLLDNCERVAATVAELVVALLARAPSATILCTSRVALGVPGEFVYGVSPLPVAAGAPELAAPPDPSGAVRLFLDRLPVQYSPPEGSEWIGSVASICRRVDGIPLAIELAAARASSLDLAELERRLATRLAVLTTRGGTRPERHRTMNALVAWSAELLDGECAAALAILGVFPGSFTLEAAEEILVAAEPSISDPLDTLIRLVDSSIVERLDRPVEGSTTRYRLLVPVREFAAAALERRADEPRVRETFHACYVRRAIEPSHSTPTDSHPLEIIRADYHNIRPAVEAYLDDPDQRDTAQALVIALFDYWYDRGSRHDAWDALQRVLGSGEELEVTPTLARLHYLSGIVSWERGDEARAQRDFEQALSLYRTLGLHLEESKALSALGNVAGAHGRREEAVALFEESVKGYREAGEIGLEGEAYNNTGGLFLTAGIHDTARAYFDRARPLLRRAGSHRILALTLVNLARLDELDGDEPAAIAAYREASEAALRASDLHTAAFSDARRGEVLAKSGDPDAAIPVLEEAIGLARRVHDERTVVFAEMNLARCYTVRGDQAEAVQRALSCIRLTCELRSPSRPDMIRLAIREAGYVAALCESWVGAAWMLGWSADYTERHNRTVSPSERERFARVSTLLSASVGPSWRQTAREPQSAVEEDALTRARDELETLATRITGES
jgi:non-specific serine/threonine protein kinase